MFTQISHIKSFIESQGYPIENIEYIDNGVMTDKYRVISKYGSYIARCYPKNREWLARAEFKYMELFHSKGIKSPKPLFFNDDNPSLLFYSELKGQTLSDVYEKMTGVQKDNICKEVIENFNKISRIEPNGFGEMIGFEKWSFYSWKQFITSKIDKAEILFTENGDYDKIKLCKGLKRYATNINCTKPHLVWNDFSLDNIIVSEDGKLAGFIDFEAMTSGDPLIAIGHQLAHDKTDFINRIISEARLKPYQKKIDFYSVFRYIKLVPYLDLPLPNGTKRNPIEEYLEYSFRQFQKFK